MLLRSFATIRAAMQRAESRMRSPRARGARHRSVGHPRRPRYKCREGLLGLEDQSSGPAEEHSGAGNLLSGIRMRIEHEVVDPCGCSARRSAGGRPHTRIAYLRLDRRRAGYGTDASAASTHSVRGVRTRDRQAEHRGQQTVCLRWKRASKEQLPKDPALFAEAQYVNRGGCGTLP